MSDDVWRPTDRERHLHEQHYVLENEQLRIEIERLRAEAERLRDAVATRMGGDIEMERHLHAEIERLHAELAKERADHLTAVGQLEDGFLVPREKIRAAWERVADKDAEEWYHCGAWDVLCDIGIVECPECGGEGHIGPGYEYTIDTLCPRCHGEGWVIDTSDETHS